MGRTYGNTDVLYLFGGERVARVRPKPFHPGVRDPIEEDHKRFHELRTWIVTRWGPIPRPAKLGEGTQKTSESHQTIAPKNATLCAWRVREGR